jgi:dolichol-phosphate mannosyltransferase
MTASILSVVIPAYNEERFIGTLLGRIAAVDLSRFGLTKEILVVDDGSSDRTAEIASGAPGVTVVRQPRNAGKGAAVRAGIARATGEYVMIQDADLEYDPSDYVPMLEALLSGRGHLVYGSRYLRDGRFGNVLGAKHPKQSWTAYLGGRSLSLAALVCTGRYLTDTVTALKLARRELLVAMDLQSSGFELDHEITAKAAARGLDITEVPISYFPRGRAEGKKIGLRDWFVAVRTFVRFRKR